MVCRWVVRGQDNVKVGGTNPASGIGENSQCVSFPDSPKIRNLNASGKALGFEGCCEQIRLLCSWSRSNNSKCVLITRGEHPALSRLPACFFKHILGFLSSIAGI